MFAVTVDHKLSEYHDKIVYTLDYLFNILGYSYRILDEEELPNVDEIALMYVSDMKIVEDYLASHPRGFAICILHDGIHYNYEKLDRNDFKGYIKKFNIGYDIPYICSREINIPISRTCDATQKRFYVGVFHFDLIGNIFFHLSGSEREIIRYRDQHKRFSYQHSNFEKYMNYPYLTGMIKLVELFLEEGEKYFRFPLVQKPLWPENKQYAISLTHNVDKLVKWNILRFFQSILHSVRSFWMVSYHWRNFWGLLRYLFDNWEPYWNFDLVSELEVDNGMRSTYFFGVKSFNRYDIDYKLGEEDLNVQKTELLNNNHEIALLSYYDSIKEDDYQERVDKLSEFSGEPVTGVRQNYFRNQDRLDSVYYKNGGLEWDSSWSMPDLQGYINGCGYPFYLTGQNWQTRTVLEMPVNFNDGAIKYDRGYFSREVLESRLEDLIDNARKFRSLLVFNFSIANFEEILFLEDIYKWLMERIKGDPTVWKATLSEINTWYRQREGVRIVNNRNIIEIEVREDMPQLTLFIKGLWRVTDILDREIIEKEQEELDIFTENTWWKVQEAEIMVKSKMLKLKNIRGGSRIRILIEKFG